MGDSTSSTVEPPVCRREALDSVEAEWKVLGDRLGSPPFLRPGWFWAWQEASAHTVDVLTTRQRGNLVGVLPITRTPRGLRLPIGSETPFFTAIVEQDEARRRLVSAALVLADHRLDLPSVLEEDEALLETILAAAERRSSRVLVSPLRESAYVQTEGTWAEYLAGMSKKRRHEVRRRRRRLLEAGDVELCVYDGKEGLDDLLAEGFRLEASGWKESYGTALDSQPRLRRFYEKLAHWAAAEGWLRLVFLELDGRPIAFDFGLQSGDVRWTLKTGFDPDYHRLSPGAVMRGHEVERAFEDDVIRYEMLGALAGTHNAWKRHWATHRHSLLRVQVFDRSVPGRLSWFHQSQWVPRVNMIGERVRDVLNPANRRRLNQAIAPLRRARGR